MKGTGQSSARAAKTPKKLYRLSAEKFADLLAVRALPVIELFFTEDPFYHRYYFPNRYFILSYLHQLKTWFWEETLPWLGHRESAIRQLVSQAITEVLHYHSAVTGGPRDQQLFAIFIFQILFDFKAGKLTTNEAYGVDHLCHTMEFFLQHMGPLPITALHNTSLTFFNSSPLAVLLSYAPKLKFIHLAGSYGNEVLKSLRMNCPNIEEIEINVLSIEDFDEIEDSLCKTFLGGLDKEQILKKMKCKERITLSFPKLRVVNMYNKGDYEWQVPKHFVFLLQHLYPDIKTKWSNVMAFENDLHRVLRSGVLCPSFVEEKDQFSFDRLSFHMWDSYERLPGNRYFKSRYLKANHISLQYDLNTVIGYPDFIHTLLSKFRCRSLELLYSPAASNQLTQAFGEVSHNLKELYLIGPISEIQDGEQLFMVLNKCLNLHVLALELDFVITPRKRILNRFLKLEALSVKIPHSPYLINLHVVCDHGRRTRTNEVHGSANKLYFANTVYEMPEKHTNAKVTEFIRKKIVHSEHQAGSHQAQGADSAMGSDCASSSGIVQNSGFAMNSSYANGSDSQDTDGKHNSDDLQSSEDIQDNAHDFNTGSGYIRMPDNVICNCYECVDCLRDEPQYGTQQYGTPVSSGYFMTDGVKYNRFRIFKRNSLTTQNDPRYYVPIKGAKVDGFGVLEYKLVNKFKQLGYVFSGYRLPSFAFYGNCNYGYRLHTSGLVGYGSCAYKYYSNASKKDNGNRGSKLYDHVNQDIKDHLVDNRGAEARENSIRLWRFDMEFGAPVPLISSLISASPNLKVLELPDLRLADVHALFCNRDLFRTLSGVQVLHLSTHFTKTMFEVITALPSLRLLGIDPEYGIDNFLRFKRSLYQTSLAVEAGKSYVWSGTSVLERLQNEP